jgi:hypothetical protein
LDRDADIAVLVVLLKACPQVKGQQQFRPSACGAAAPLSEKWYAASDGGVFAVAFPVLQTLASAPGSGPRPALRILPKKGPWPREREKKIPEARDLMGRQGEAGNPMPVP